MTITSPAPNPQSDNRNGRGRRRARRDLVAGGALVVVALLLVVSPVPVLVRLLVALPVLVVLPGHLLTALLLGHRPAGAGDRPEFSIMFRRTMVENDEDRSGADPLIRGAMAVVLGVLWLLLTVLVIAVVGARIDTTSCAIALAVGSGLLLTGMWWSTRGSSDTELVAHQPLFPRSIQMAKARGVAGILAAVLVIVAALAGARAVQPTKVEQYTVISFDDPRMLQAEPLTSGPAGQVGLRWTLRSYGEDLPSGTPTVSVSVGGGPAAGLTTLVGLVSAPDGSDPTDAESGSANFAAPRQPGLYQIRLDVTAGGQTHALSAYLEVSS